MEVQFELAVLAGRGITVSLQPVARKRSEAQNFYGDLVELAYGLTVSRLRGGGRRSSAGTTSTIDANAGAESSFNCDGG